MNIEHPVRIGTAGWNIPKELAAAFPSEGSHLERYARVFPAVEINSSFYRPHRVTTYERWAGSVPDLFRFAVKIPKSITHESRLQATDVLLDRFLSEVAGLGQKLGPLLVQLPPSLPLEPAFASSFFLSLRRRVSGSIACEPRHPSWFTASAEALLREFEVGRVAADPALAPGAERPGGWPGLTYYRLHGSPHVYHSSYSEEAIQATVAQLAQRRAQGSECWCIFDNTAASAATHNALSASESARVSSRSEPAEHRR